MINAVSTDVAQNVASNANILFNATNVRTNSCKSCNCKGWLNFNGVSSGLFEITKAGIYQIHFNANVSPTVAGQITVNITNSGENIIGGEMQTPGTAPDTFENIAAEILVEVPCNCCDTFTIKNSTGNPIIVNNPSLTIERLA